MKDLKVSQITEDSITFEDGTILSSYHEDDCCENHSLHFENLTMADFEGMVFDLSDDKFFKPIAGYGIELNPVVGWPIRVPGYGSNNGYYSTNLVLTLNRIGHKQMTWDITECQVIDDGTGYYYE